MAQFLVHTIEHVAGTYLVEADSAEEAEAQFGNPRIDWEGVEQIDYVAFSCEVERVTERP